jgi:hypothetical protein
MLFYYKKLCEKPFTIELTTKVHEYSLITDIELWTDKIIPFFDKLSPRYTAFNLQFGTVYYLISKHNIGSDMTHINIHYCTFEKHDDKHFITCFYDKKYNIEIQLFESSHPYNKDKFVILTTKWIYIDDDNKRYNYMNSYFDNMQCNVISVKNTKMNSELLHKLSMVSRLISTYIEYNHPEFYREYYYIGNVITN